MSLLIALLIGIGMGTAIGLWFRRNGDYMVIDLAIGIAGSIFGLALYFFTHTDQALYLVSLGGVVASIIGAAIGLALFQVILLIPKDDGGTKEP